MKVEGVKPPVYSTSLPQSTGIFPSQPSPSTRYLIKTVRVCLVRKKKKKKCKRKKYKRKIIIYIYIYILKFDKLFLFVILNLLILFILTR